MIVPQYTNVFSRPEESRPGYDDSGPIQFANELTPPQPPSGFDSDPGAISLAFLISLSVTFAMLMLILIVIAAYLTFFSTDETEYDEENASRSNVPPNIGRTRPFHSLLFNKKHNGLLLDSSFNEPGDSEDSVKFKEIERNEFKKMSNFEIQLYERCKEFQKLSPPNVSEFGTFLKSNDLTFIKDRGISSFYLLPSINDNVDIEGNFLPSFIVQDKLDVTFTKFNQSSSTIMNYPFPYNKKDAVYFEVKVFKHFNEHSNTIFSIGLTTIPNPYFRIPGTYKYSIAYESTGKLRINNPFTASTLLPKLQEGDVVGFGYKYKTGTIFITHNGKKLMDVTQGVNIDLFVSIGAINASYTRTYTKDGLLEDPDNVSLREALSEGRDIQLPEKIQKVHDPNNISDMIENDEVQLQLNLGQIGYVFIEANVKKYAFASVYGQIGVPPAYNGAELNKDIILQKGEELPPSYLDNNNDNIISIGTSTAGQLGLLEGTSSDRRTSNYSQNQSHDLQYERASSAYDQEHNAYDDALAENELSDNEGGNTKTAKQRKQHKKHHKKRKKRLRK
ncbi:hypothetical protein KAFR_0D03040 [Kazachstania africana CBS 2517]|uniref:B30.2/SPRY domain-containing protein n=1 Tax=Kazachstania africana (strain ATCC 22294 / BCRC 22015 / CBS 2517 / CECT 1963 / NBRC 1671 / NRRL Y-8276) TaxID=1071382 RepID=H2AUA2_KAZAF|nr:hypothetical protein KAFR_0D03040 [Kazachstania africana CBS 2517]CCF57952.1 hypothetical protein KAFR_0D03040 [Kazachstania africana CBS 2517]